MKHLSIALLATTAFSLGCVALNDSGGSQINNTPPPRQSICADLDSPIGCGAECNTDLDCDSTTFCNSGACDAVCTMGGTECGDNATCIEHGRCLDFGQDGGSSTDGGICADIELETERVIPNIALIVDKSGSMVADFEGDCPRDNNPNDGCEDLGYDNPAFDVSRWDAAREALIGNPATAGDGIVGELESIARFSWFAYDKPYSENSPDLTCDPRMVSVPTFALNNGGAIQTLYAGAEPVSDGFTPTAEAVKFVREQVMSSPPTDGPTAFVLATDGFPNGCDNLAEAEDQTNSVNEVANAYATQVNGAPIETFVLGVSFGGASGGTHLQALANAGQGPGTTDAEWWMASDADELEDKLRTIVTSQIPCEADLVGRIVLSAACSGTVQLDGETLACNNPTRGWRAVDDDTIELLGSACEDWRGGEASSLIGSWPCGAVIVE